MCMNIIEVLATELEINTRQVEAAIKLIDEGNTIPFIARYRKEVTGSLNDEVLRKLDERLLYLRNLEERKTQVIELIKEQGKLDKELEDKILAAKVLVEVEDLYRPYKQKRRTRAMIAKEKGLEPLAIKVFEEAVDSDIEAFVKKYISEDSNINVEDYTEAIDGINDIIAEYISDSAEYRRVIRELTFNKGLISSSNKEDTDSVYEMYYSYEELVKSCPGHRVLAINRGEKEKILSVKINAPDEEILDYLQKKVIRKGNIYTREILEVAISDAYKRLIQPAIEREIRNELTQKAQEGAIKVFGENLKQLLMQAPIKNKIVLGWDPAFRTGCKLAVVDHTGKVLHTAVIYPTAPQNKVEDAKKTLISIINKYNIDLISVGNGTASRESELIIADLLKEIDKDVKYIIVNEAGASVYSASKLAAVEFPDFDVAQRSAVSIARRLQDPLAELVKIEPKSIGVGQYQHDMDQKNLAKALDAVVEDCVNKVGVDLNTASISLLEYISGINKAIAKNIVEYRELNGQFTNRKQLLKVSKLGTKAFEQCAGFMRIREGKEILDSTALHPESYEVTKKLIQILGLNIDSGLEAFKGLSKKISDYEKLAKELDIGEITLKDIVGELEKPGLDPRDDMPKPILRTDVLDMKDLKEGMLLKGTVRNIIDFGAFIDIGVHQDGLVHISQMAKKYIKHPLEVVKVGDVVDVKVLSVDILKKRIALTMII